MGSDIRERVATTPILSVIIPLYNIENYARDSIDGVINQTIDFEANIQLILVNDGSTDGTADICREYESRYPNNVVFIDQENQGVSASRNNGLKHATGRYVNFLDGDDIWSRDALGRAVSFLDANQNVDFVAFKLKFFDKIIDEHPANYKFKQTRVINVEEEPDSPIFHMISCVFRREALDGRSFDERLVISEDAKLLSEILHDKKAYGVLAEGHYNYRKRQDESSAIGGQRKNKDFYTITPELAYRYMMDLWQDDDGVVEEFMQYQILSDLAWRLEQSSQDGVLTEAEEAEYKNTLYGLVARVSDKAILTKRGLPLRHKVFLLKKRYGEEYRDRLSLKGGVYYFEGQFLCDITVSNNIYIDFIHNLGEGRIKLEGYIAQPDISGEDRYEFKTSLGEFPVTRVERAQRYISFLGDEVYCGGGFEVELRVADDDYISAGVKDDSNTLNSVKINTTELALSRLTHLPTSYHQFEDKVVVRKGKGFKVDSIRGSSLFKLELKHLGRILLSWRLGRAREQFRKLRTRNLDFLNPKARVFEVAKPFLFVAEAIAMIPRAILLRVAVQLVRPRLKRPIWLISDRGMAAGDNGEALFRHIQDRDDVYADVYFVISKKSSDYSRMKQYGKVLNQDSLRYKLMFLLSSKIISSQADIETTNPFFRQLYHYADLFYFDFIFLQHGVIRNDLSGWLNRFNKDIKLFVTSAQAEYDSILNYPYYYAKEQVVLTGLPRHDLLDNKPANKLILAPTYRKAVARKKTNANGIRPYDELFKESDYYRFYNKLIHDKRLLGTLEKYNMTGEFYLHPVFAPQTVDFKSNDRFRVMDYPYDYKTAFSEGSLLVSDYSSVVFDFAYLKKPIIYNHFDVEDFYTQQIYDKGDFFSDEVDGFGPVSRTYEELVDEIIRAIEGGCVMADEYKERVDSFFYKVDKNNSRRVYEAIVAQDI